MTTPENRPRSVDAAFWCWLLAAVLLVALGLLTFTNGVTAVRAAGAADGTDVSGIVTLFQGTGIIAVLVGLGTAFLARQVRRGDDRFRRAALALSVVAAFILLLASLGVSVLFIVPLGVLLAASVLITRPSAKQWFGISDRSIDG